MKIYPYEQSFFVSTGTFSFIFEIVKPLKQAYQRTIHSSVAIANKIEIHNVIKGAPLKGHIFF